ncbi:phytoene desaturase family protein [Williamsia serinedens]|uniref:Phytoene dehydrogenase-related protein n=1 Tax=Williamsia serinedens TaxID=391736 RepID=A0ABT1H193_9NOCA|nr:NAD(P)/FAD-dependent oxidoreductase [Williamsia serinedens]MCP2160906.1 Phytoene dehydrogenase-related protein [Williamsia serinedens]
MTTAVVVGSGPNGLAAAVHLARSGVSVTVLEAANTIGGGTRSGELTLPGLIHDHCSGFHPLGVGSPFLAGLDLERYGLHWDHAPIDCAHPLDDGTAALLHRSIDTTADGLGRDGARWRALVGPLASRFDDLASEVMRPIAHVPRHLLALATLGPRALPPASVTMRLFGTPQGRAAFAGSAAHAYTRLDRPLTSAVGLMLAASGHRFGWPVARGGSASITNALAAMLTDLGGTVETGCHVRSAAEIPRADVVLLDTSPGVAVDIYGDAIPHRIRKAYTRFRRAPGAFKVDYAVEGPVPWAAEGVASAGTVHVCGDADEVVEAERQVSAGVMPSRPFLIVGQQYVADPTRSADGLNPLYAYAHVPHGFTGDATETITAQIERFAPGFRDRIRATTVTTTTEFAQSNPNLAGGDVIGGSNGGLQVLLRPRPAIDPYATGVDGAYLCSASTPPGAGAHGMCGYNAAESALRHLRR